MFSGKEVDPWRTSNLYPFDLVHTDPVGPIKTRANEKLDYFIIFGDLSGGSST